MTLPLAPAQLSHSMIMAEWSHPANTEWKISADGAAYISFTVGSIIKESDFYGRSATKAMADMVAVAPWRGIAQSEDLGVTFSAMTKENFGPGTTLGFNPSPITPSADGLYRTHLFPQTVVCMPSSLSSTGYYYFANTTNRLGPSCWALSETGGHLGDDWVAINTNDASDGSPPVDRHVPNPGTGGNTVMASPSNLGGHNGQGVVNFSTGMLGNSFATGGGTASYHPLTSMDGPYRLQDMESSRISSTSWTMPNALMQGPGAGTGSIYWTGSAWTVSFSQNQLTTGHGGPTPPASSVGLTVNGPTGGNGGNWLSNHAGAYGISTSRNSNTTALISKAAIPTGQFTPQGSYVRYIKIHWDPSGNFGMHPGATTGVANMDISPATFTGGPVSPATHSYAGGYAGNQGEAFIVGNPNYANKWLVVAGGRILYMRPGQDPSFGGGSGGAWDQSLMTPPNFYPNLNNDVNGTSDYNLPEGQNRITGVTVGGSNFGDTVCLGHHFNVPFICRATGDHAAGNWTFTSLGTGFGNGSGCTGRLWWCDTTNAFYGVMNFGQLFRSTNLTTWTLCLDPGATTWSSPAGYTPSQPQGNAGVEDLASPGIYNYHD